MKNKLHKQMLVLVHRRELVLQAEESLIRANPSLKIQVEMGSYRANPNADVVVASVASMNVKRSAKYSWQNFDKVVVDEVHRGIAPSYIKLYERIGITQENWNGLLLGCTATPQRADGKALAEIFDRIVYEYNLRKAIEEGWLVDVRGIRVRTGQSLDEVKIVGGDFAQDDLAKAIDNPRRNNLVLKAWLENAENRPTIGFTASVAHAQHLAELFQKSGIAAEAVWGDDPERDDKRRRFIDGETTVVFNCALWTEGVDIWRASCVLLARPTKSGVFYSQAIGRGTRLQEGTGNLLEWSGGPIKRDCIILDVVDATRKHSLVTLPSLFGMSSSLDLRGKSLLQSAIKLEHAQQEYQHLDFSALDSIDNLETFIEKVDLFQVHFPEEVENNSILSWHKSATGGYVLMLPNHDEVRIRENLLTKFDLHATIKGKKYAGERSSIEEAFQRADQLVQDLYPEALKIVKREEKWHSLPPTPAQFKLIAKLFKGKQIPNKLTRGEASKLIGSRLA